MLYEFYYQNKLFIYSSSLPFASVLLIDFRKSHSCPLYSRRIMETPLKDMNYSLLCLTVLHSIINNLKNEIKIFKDQFNKIKHEISLYAKRK